MRFNLNLNLVCLIFISIVLISCSKDFRIEEKKFVKMYAEMIFMQDTSSLSPSVIKEIILKRFSVNENDYGATIKFYNENPVRWQKFFDEVIVYMESLKPKPKKNDVKSLQEQS
jgi:hypothetical protein